MMGFVSIHSKYCLYIYYDRDQNEKKQVLLKNEGIYELNYSSRT